MNTLTTQAQPNPLSSSPPNLPPPYNRREAGQVTLPVHCSLPVPNQSWYFLPDLRTKKLQERVQSVLRRESRPELLLRHFSAAAPSPETPRGRGAFASLEPSVSARLNFYDLRGRAAASSSKSTTMYPKLLNKIHRRLWRHEQPPPQSRGEFLRAPGPRHITPHHRNLQDNQGAPVPGQAAATALLGGHFPDAAYRDP